jgi:hypothetical protein
LRASHQVCHFSPRKIANDSVHMKTHAGMESRHKMVTTGNVRSGTQPGHAAALLRTAGSGWEVVSNGWLALLPRVQSTSQPVGGQ